MKVYKSKVDLWLMCLLIGVLTAPIILAWVIGEGLWVTLPICGLTLVFTAWLYLATQYRISETNLIIHAGVYKINIPIKSIKSVVSSKNVMASPAFSLDRLEITYKKNKRILISPKDKNRFLSDIGWLDETISVDAS